MRTFNQTMTVALLAALAGCGVGTAGDVIADSVDVAAAADGVGVVPASLADGVPVGSTLRLTEAAALRTGPGTTFAIRVVLPAGTEVEVINDGQPTGGWFSVRYHSLDGWIHGAHLALVSSPTTPDAELSSELPEKDPLTLLPLHPASSPPATTTPSTPPASSTPTTTPAPTPTPAPSAREAALARARTGVGFSYWWGHGRWLPSGPTTSTRGACTGSCPSCTHSGGYGADCSGYVGKIWQVGSNNTDVTVDRHPYSTINFISSNSQWSTVSRGAVKLADALVYNTSGHGHIFLYEKGDGWGSMWAFEAKGCSYGIVHNVRTASSAYKAIRRTGY